MEPLAKHSTQAVDARKVHVRGLARAIFVVVHVAVRVLVPAGAPAEEGGGACDEVLSAGAPARTTTSAGRDHL